jgi:tripartite-type tricarboxylate transporter receptor subunit TctC
MTTYRRFTRRLALTVACLIVAGIASAPALDYPTRPVRIVVPFTPSGATDITARLIGRWLSERLGQTFIIENRPGAGANIGTEAVVRAPPDGYTLLLESTSNAINATLYDKLNFDVLTDVVPVAGIMRTPLIMLVHPSFPAKAVPGFIAYAKANPGKVNMASPGIGSPNHVSGELFNMMADVKMVHIPYRVTGSAFSDLVAGQVEVMFGTVTATIEYVKAGTLRPLAVSSATRLEALPGIPTVDETLPSYETSFWSGIAAPKTTSAEIVGKLNKEINAGLADPNLKARLAALGGTVLAGPPEAFGRLIADETKKWANVVKFSRAKELRP